MKTTDAFKTAILKKMEDTAETDEQFAIKFNNEAKNIDDCITYILNQVKQSKCNGFEDDEIYGIAMHYYDEEDIEIGRAINCKVVVNHTVELSDDEKEAARKEARQQVINEEMKRLREKSKQQKKEEPATAQQSLF